MPYTTNDWQRFIAVLFISRFCLFLPGTDFVQLAMHLKIYPFRPNSPQEVGRNMIVVLPTHLSRSILFVACFTTEQSVGKASLFVKYHLISISVLLRDWSCVLPQIFWSGVRKTTAFVNKIYDITTTNYSYLETSAINVSDQDCVHVAIAINWLYSDFRW